MTIEETQPQPPSPALVLACSRALATKHPEIPADDREKRAVYLATHRAVGIDHRGNLFVDSASAEMVEKVAPKLLDTEAVIDAKTKIDRSVQREAILRSRLDASRQPPKKLEPITQRLADAVAADPRLQGHTSAAKTARARVRERLVAEAMTAAGRPLGALGSNGVSE